MGAKCSCCCQGKRSWFWKGLGSSHPASLFIGIRAVNGTGTWGAREGTSDIAHREPAALPCPVPSHTEALLPPLSALQERGTI